EDDAISEERLAWKADIRIIDGVWYKNDGTFPGKPIWSDHPGKAKTVTVTDGFVPKDIEVGQDDIKTLYSYPKIPRRYSYYEYDKSNAELCESTAGSDCGNEDHVGVISYGTLFRDGTDPLALEWTPGFWRFHLNTEAALGQTAGVVPPATAKRDVYCGRNLTGDPYTGGSEIVDAKTHDRYYEDSSSNWHTAEKGSNYLEAARSGFDDPRVHLGQTDVTDDKRGRMLPINFDLKQ
ncbi:MAG: hypothetical protein GY822_02080, partial [Deltaproteobacteria bacterium]|nr:hypothetical protein [Deltaproteobacteria bacterium]